MTNENGRLRCLSCKKSIKINEDFFDVPLPAPEGLSLMAGLHWNCLYRIGFAWAKAEVKKKKKD